MLRKNHAEQVNWFINYADGEELGVLNNDELRKEITEGARALDGAESTVVGMVIESASKDVTVEVELNCGPHSSMFLWLGHDVAQPKELQA
jgi:hypothetical protein